VRFISKSECQSGGKGPSFGWVRMQGNDNSWLRRNSRYSGIVNFHRVLYFEPSIKKYLKNKHPHP
jgi:hypothetical protein